MMEWTGTFTRAGKAGWPQTGTPVTRWYVCGPNNFRCPPPRLCASAYKSRAPLRESLFVISCQTLPLPVRRPCERELLRRLKRRGCQTSRRAGGQVAEPDPTDGLERDRA
jgi:hypothetical protein